MTLAEAIENIDIGGPSMVRSAAKNHRFVTIVTDPLDYTAVLQEMQVNNGEVSEATRNRLAVDAYAHTAKYDSAIYNYLQRQYQPEDTLPEQFLQPCTRVAHLRYGENPHQEAAFYQRVSPTPIGLAAAKQLHGKELSFNNYLDLEAVLGFIAEYREPAVMIVKHNNPCGAAVAKTLAQAYRDALATDPVSAFGGIIGLNAVVDGETAAAIAEGMEKYGFMECILAPGYTPEALERLTVKRDLRLLELPNVTAADPWAIKQVTGGLVVQTRDTASEPMEMRVATRRSPDRKRTRLSPLRVDCLQAYEV